MPYLYDYTPFEEAITSGDVNAVRKFLKEGANPNEKTEYATPLELAAAENSEICRLLLEHGADINKGYLSPLANSMRYGNIETARFLIEHGADVNYGGDDGIPPLHFAVHNNLACTKLLLDNGANIQTRNHYGNTLLMAAVSRKTLAPLRFLLENYKLPLNEKNNNGETALMLAVRSGFPEAVDLLITKGANVHELDNNGATALRFALDTTYAMYPGPKREDTLACVRSLLSAGLDPEKKDKCGESAIDWASKYHPNMLPLLKTAVTSHQKGENTEKALNAVFNEIAQGWEREKKENRKKFVKTLINTIFKL